MERRSWLLPLLPLLFGACTSQPLQTYSYSCTDGTRFNTGRGGDEITLAFEERTVTLPRVHSGSGEKYTDRQLLFWNRGDEAILATGHSMIRCQSLK